MRTPPSQAPPRARTDKLIIRELPDEVLVYDLERDKAHCLNQTAALIWRNCDGHTTAGELARKLARAISPPPDEQMIWFALKQLGNDHLLVEPVILPVQMQGLTRRQMIRALGLTAAVALPLVTTIVAPTPAQAHTCIGSGGPCAQSSDCCSGLCNGGTCA